jgi:uncharacterized repeat protein (TIGR01451 family)
MKIARAFAFLQKRASLLIFVLFVGVGLWAVPHTVFAQCQPDIVVTKTADVSTALVGDTVTYTITVEQVVPNCSADNVTLSDTLPTEVAIASPIGGPDAGDCTEFAGGFNCNFGTLTVESRQITVTVQVTGGEGTTVDNLASATTSTIEPDLTNNEDTASFQVVAPTPVPTPTPVPPVGVPELEGSGCALNLGATGASASFYGLGSVLLAAALILRSKGRK